MQDTYSDLGVAVLMPGARIAEGERVTLRTVEREDLAFCQRASANPEIRCPLCNPLESRAPLEEEWGEDKSGDHFLVYLDSEALRAPGRASGRSPRADDVGPGQPDDDDTRAVGVVSVEDAD